MSDVKISQLPVATILNPSDAIPIDQGGTTKQAAASLFTGSYISSNIARVDPNGDDSTGTVGHLTKPFQTVQAAINSSNDFGVIDIGNNQFTEDLVLSSFKHLTIVGASQMQGGLGAGINGSITVVYPGGTAILALDAIFVAGDIIFTQADTAVIYLRNGAFLVANVTSQAGDLAIQGANSPENGASCDVEGTALAKTGSTLYGYDVVLQQAGSAKSCNVYLQNSQAAGVSADGLTLRDSRTTFNYVAWEWNTITFSDKLLDPSFFNFATLPQATSEPAILTGQAWIDTTAGTNIVKVKL